jgi:hypothetical protein
VAEEMSVKLPEGVLKPIIEAQVVSALQGQTHLIGEMVRFVLTEKRRDERTYRDYPFLEYVLRNVLHNQVTAAVNRWVSDNSALIQKEVERELNVKRKDIAGQMVSALVGGDARWKFSVGVSINNER